MTGMAKGGLRGWGEGAGSKFAGERARRPGDQGVDGGGGSGSIPGCLRRCTALAIESGRFPCLAISQWLHGAEPGRGTMGGEAGE